MIIKVDQMSKSPLYLQIRDQIVQALAQGSLHPGDALPSVRSLAADLGINLHTVNKAYAVLRDEGYVLMRGRSGAFIADYERASSPERNAAADAQLEQELYRLALEYKARGGTQERFMNMVETQLNMAYREGEQR